VILNTLGFYTHLLDFLEHMIKGSFLRLEHRNIWEVADNPSGVVAAIRNNRKWIDDPRKIARI